MTHLIETRDAIKKWQQYAQSVADERANVLPDNPYVLRDAEFLTWIGIANFLDAAWKLADDGLPEESRINAT